MLEVVTEHSPEGTFVYKAIVAELLVVLMLPILTAITHLVRKPRAHCVVPLGCLLPSCRLFLS